MFPQKTEHYHKKCEFNTINLYYTNGNEIDIENEKTRKEIKCFFDSFMETLTLKQKEALQFRREGYTLAEIAKMVSVPTSVSSVQERLDRAYYKMTKKWNQLHPNDKVPEFPSPDAKKKKK